MLSVTLKCPRVSPGLEGCGRGVGAVVLRGSLTLAPQDDGLPRSRRRTDSYVCHCEPKGRSNPFFRSSSLDCFVAIAPRNDETQCRHSGAGQRPEPKSIIPVCGIFSASSVVMDTGSRGAWHRAGPLSGRTRWLGRNDERTGSIEVKLTDYRRGSGSPLRGGELPAQLMGFARGSSRQRGGGLC